MSRWVTRIAAALFCVCLGLTARMAAGPEGPALAKATAVEKTRLQELVKSATQEGQISYWDTIFQPETNDALSAEFHKQYGLPSGFKVNYTLSSTSGLVTRIDQELGA